MARTKQKSGEPTIIKKYANRRLYDTGRSSYVTLDDLAEMVKDGYDFVVVDAKSGEDLTRTVLTQIIVDQESKGDENLLPISFLRQLIGFYGDDFQTMLPNYLEQTMQFFTKNQEDFQKQMGQPFEKPLDQSFGGMNMMDPVGAMEELNKKNMEMFENAMRAWSPFMGGESGGKSASGKSQSASQSTPQSAPQNAPASADATKVKELQDMIARMQGELDSMSGS